jgi:hypothetical protein
LERIPKERKIHRMQSLQMSSEVPSNRFCLNFAGVLCLNPTVTNPRQEYSVWLNLVWFKRALLAL